MALARHSPFGRPVWRHIELLRASAPSPLPTASTSRIQFRSYADAAAQTTAGRNTAKETEMRIAKAKKVSQMPGLNSVRQDQPLQDVAVLPPLKQIGYKAVEKPLKYTWKRMRRAMATIRSLWAIRKADTYSKTYEPHPYLRIWKAMGGMLWPQYKLKPLREHLQGTWNEWNTAIASGDADTYKALSKGAAFDFARSRALAAGQGSRMDWRVNQYYSEPRIVHARSWVVDEGGQVAVGQVIVRFDTEQTVTIHQRNKAPASRTSRILEYWCFERYMGDPASQWQIRDKISPFTGGPIPKTMV